ncbi:MAG: PD40 domain-containing protein [Bacteroidetes bacterium]|nr:PD40 domain-containing protein [Bacteroidota bacterium]
MRTLLFFLCLFALQYTVISQKKTDAVGEKKWTDDERKQMEKAELLYFEKNYKLPLPIYAKLRETHPNDVRLKYVYAICGLLIPGRQEICLDLLKEVYEKNKKAAEIDYFLAKANFLNYNFDEAIAGIATYKSKNKKLTPEQLKDCDQIVTYCNNAKLLVPQPVSVRIENMGNIINTAAAESSPCLTDDENVIIFTYKGEKSKGGLQNAFNQPNINGVYYEDVYTSSKVNGVWKTPEEIKSLNTINNEAVLFLSNDGQKLFINIDSQQDDGDIYMSTLDKDVWGAPVKLVGDVNSKEWENNSSLSPDGKTLYFSSNRPGGFGGKDIYKSQLLPDGTWGKAKNLGDKINTALDEDAPFIHYDGRLLLFCSQGHNSIGGYDIFKTYMNVTDSTWSAAENMGCPINTPGDEIHYVLSPSGDNGYYGLGKVDGYGDFDIYKVEPGITGIMPVIAVSKGRVTLDTLPVEAEITVEVPARNTVFRTLKSNDKTGAYRITLPVGEDYKITWKLNNFPVQTKLIEAKNATAYLLDVKDINFSTKDVVKTDVASIDTAMWHTGNEHIDGLVYKIQVSAEYLNENIRRRKARKLGEVEKEVVNDVARFTLKEEFKTYNEATAKVKKVRDLIVADAFIVGIYKGKRCYLSELRTQGILKIK